MPITFEETSVIGIFYWKEGQTIMAYTVAGMGLANTDNINETTSINIKSNRQSSTTRGVSFEGVLVSGMQVDRRQIDKNTYASLIKEADDVKSQIMESATNAKSNLKALFNKLSGAEAVRIDEEGFNLTDMSAEEAVSILDKIRIELAAYCEDYEVTGSSISTDKIEAVVGSKAGAEAVVGKLESAGIPLTEENIDELTSALSEVDLSNGISELAKLYLVSNGMEPTIENVHIASAANSSGGNSGINSNGKASDSVSDKEWEQLKSQIERMFEKAGIVPDDKDWENAKTLVSKDIPVTEETLSYMNRLDKVVCSKEELAESVINNMAVGGDARHTYVTGHSNIAADVAKAMEVLSEVEYSHVEYACAKQEETNEPVSLKSIEEAIDAFKYNSADSVASDMTNQQRENVNTTYRMILEMQIMMTSSSGMYLEHNGVSVMQESISLLHSRLEAFEKENFMEQIAIQLAEDIDSPEVQSAYRLSFDIRRAMYDMKYMPDVAIGAWVQEENVTATVSISAFAESGRNYRERFRQAGETYEALGTSKRADMGDSVAKALKNSTEDILNGLGLEDNTYNRSAVRILAYNSLEMTSDNIDRVKELYATLNSLIDHMTPEVCLSMIRDGINPMTEDIHTLNDYLVSEADKSYDGDRDDDSSKYSTFLYKLDRTGGITEEERRQFIGIYKMLNMFTKDAGVAIGTLYKQNAQMTMENLCAAYSSVRHAGMDIAVDDSTDVKVAATKAYYVNLFESSSGYITPNTLKNVQDSKDINSRSIENFCEAVEECYDASREAEYYQEYVEMLKNTAQADEAVLRDITQAGYDITVSNIEAFEMMMDTSSVCRLMLSDKRTADTWLSKLSSREELEAEYEALKAEDDAGLKELTEAEDTSYDEFKSRRLQNRQIGIITNLAKRNDYSVPVVTKNGISMMKLTLTSESSEKGRISISFESKEWGKTSVEAKVDLESVDLYGICNKDEQSLKSTLSSVSEELKAHFTYESVNVYCGHSELVNRITYEDAAGSVATGRLYEISKIIISNLV